MAGFQRTLKTLNNPVTDSQSGNFPLCYKIQPYKIVKTDGKPLLTSS